MGKKYPDVPDRSPDGLTADEMLRDLWKAHYGKQGIMLRLDRVERQVKWAGWIGKTALGAAIFAFIEWGWGKAFG